MPTDLAAALDATLDHARNASERLTADGGDVDRDAVRMALANVDAMLGEAVAVAPNELRFHLADARSKVAALLLAADQLEDVAGSAHAHRLWLRAATEGASVAARYRGRADSPIAV